MFMLNKISESESESDFSICDSKAVNKMHSTFWYAHARLRTLIIPM